MIGSIGKEDVYRYVIDHDMVTAMQISNDLDCSLTLVTGYLIKLRGDGKIMKTRGEGRMHTTKWSVNPNYYVVGKTRRRT